MGTPVSIIAALYKREFDVLYCSKCLYGFCIVLLLAKKFPCSASVHLPCLQQQCFDVAVPIALQPVLAKVMSVLYNLEVYHHRRQKKYSSQCVFTTFVTI